MLCWLACRRNSFHGGGQLGGRTHPCCDWIMACPNSHAFPQIKGVVLIRKSVDSLTGWMSRWRQISSDALPEPWNEWQHMRCDRTRFYGMEFQSHFNFCWIWRLNILFEIQSQDKPLVCYSLLFQMLREKVDEKFWMFNGLFEYSQLEL